MSKKIIAVNADSRKGWNTDIAYMGLLQNYQQILNRFVGQTELLVSGDTIQLENYSKLD